MQSRIIAKVTKSVQIGKDELKKEYKSEKVPMSESAKSSLSAKKPRGPIDAKCADKLTTMQRFATCQQNLPKNGRLNW